MFTYPLPNLFPKGDVKLRIAIDYLEECSQILFLIILYDCQTKKLMYLSCTLCLWIEINERNFILIFDLRWNSLPWTKHPNELKLGLKSIYFSLHVINTKSIENSLSNIRYFRFKTIFYQIIFFENKVYVARQWYSKQIID